MHSYVTVLNTDIGFIRHLRRAVYRSTGLHGPKEDDDDDGSSTDARELIRMAPFTKMVTIRFEWVKDLLETVTTVS